MAAGGVIIHIEGWMIWLACGWGATIMAVFYTGKAFASNEKDIRIEMYRDAIEEKNKFINFLLELIRSEEQEEEDVS